MQLAELWLYPVKAMAGVAVPRALATPQGLAYEGPEGHWHRDRQWLVIKGAGQMVTQRQCPALALLQPVFTAQGLSLRAPSGQLMPVLPPRLDAPRRQGQVWKSPCDLVLAEGEVHAWLSQVLGSTEPLFLAAMAPGYQRPGLEARFGAEHHTVFADAAPYLLTQQASLRALNQHLAQRQEPAVGMQRFRGNLVLDGGAAFAEQAAPSVRVGTAEFVLVDHCQRCSVITVDPERGLFDPEAHPFHGLAECNPMPDNPKAPAFGMNARLMDTTEHWLELGDTAAWGKNRY
jgi:uncharacterized protein